MRSRFHSWRGLRPSGLAAIIAAAVVVATLSPALPATAGHAAGIVPAAGATSETPSPSPTPTPTPPVPPPDCSGTVDARTSRRVPFLVCETVVISKKHRVTSAYRPALVTANLPRYGLSKVRLQAVAATAARKLFAAAKHAGHKLVVRSAYRSYGSQKSIYHPGDKLTAPPGASEHQSGLAMDIAARKGSKVYRGYGFGTSSAGRWIRAHAAAYGFIVRYPKGQQKITGIPYEPWHLRWVGTSVAQQVVKTPTRTLERCLKIV